MRIARRRAQKIVEEDVPWALSHRNIAANA